MQHFTAALSNLMQPWSHDLKADVTKREKASKLINFPYLQYSDPNIFCNYLPCYNQQHAVLVHSND